MKRRYMCTIIEGVIVVSGSVSLVMHVVRHTKAQYSGSNSSERMKRWTQAKRRSICLFYTSGFGTYNSVLNINGSSV